jgi:hypothetical protein
MVQPKKKINKTKASRNKTSSANNKPFEEEYWQDVYGTGETVDGNFNAKEHARYLRSLFDLMGVRVKSIIDFGFGNGILFQAFVNQFKPAHVQGVEPSNLMFDQILAEDWYENTNIALSHTTIEGLSLPPALLPFDLGICNSVLQYIDTDIEVIFDKLSTYTRYLYFSVPTKADYQRMKKDLSFEDPFAYLRTKKFYTDRLSPFFTIVSHNVLESKKYPKEQYSFMDELYQF